MKMVRHVTGKVSRAVSRARIAIFSVFCLYAVSTIIGMWMAHSGNSFALSYRDNLVNQAGRQDPAARSFQQGSRLQAALMDFTRNLTIGAIPKTIMGIGIIFPYPWVAYQGWIGGIVSVRNDHSSRLDDPRSATYYLLTVLLQIIAYSLTVGSGVNVGIASFRPQEEYRGEKWMALFPKEAVKDVGRVYLLAIPIFLIASIWEFLSAWNI